ncbi:MAG: protein-disulfide reductase DsbD family protein [Caulobacteraceae bacterium]
MKPPIIALLAAAVALLTSAGARAAAVTTPHVTSELVAQSAGAAPGGTVYVAVAQSLDRGWHTYWRNPGDAGEAAKIAWTLPAGWRAGDIVWPAPERLPVGPLMNYGYEGKVLLPIPIEIPVGAKPGASASLKAVVDYLVCAEVCIPGSATLTLNLPVVAGLPAADPRWGPAIAAALAAAPKPAGLAATFRQVGTKLGLAVAGAPLAGTAAADAYFYPYDDTLIDQSQPEAVQRGARGLSLAMTAGSAFKKTPGPASASGVLAVDGKAYEITATPGPPPAGSFGLGPPARAGGPSGGLLAAMGLALLGGLILNLMPCVFPILSMKAAALAGHAEEPTRSRAQGVAFLIGVLATFLALAGVLIGAKAGGAAIGWGFQLQSPLVVAALGLVMLAAALNLSGLYEIGTSAQGLGAGFAARGGLLGSALTGVLAVVVAAPCTAPFMGPALGYALTQPALVALAVFAALGLGFAAPFTLLAFSPALMRRLPRPGPWMDVLRKALAFPMYAAAAWLAWVLALQAGPAGLARLLAAALALAFAAWLFGLGQRRRAAGRGAPVALVLAALSLVLCVAAVAVGGYGSAVAAAGPAPAGVPASQPYSPERLAALRAQGRPILVNFTAAWCVTCQVNERLAFSSPRVAAAFRRTGATYLIADWTNRDVVIAKALADQGRIGVPLYLVYGAGDAQPKILPQLLTPSIVAEALERAAAKAGPAATG